MKCFTPDELIRFGMEPANQEGCGIALHLMQCPRCRENYQLALECINEDGYELSDSEEESASELDTLAALWEKFYSAVDELANKISGAGLFKSAAFSFQRTVPSMQLAAARSGSSGSLGFKVSEEIRFTFESYAAPESGSYWKMQMTLPRVPAASALISMKVTGADGAPLEGTLNFLNQKNTLSCGCANVPFRSFLENKGCKEISFTTAAGKVSPGRIKFLPEALR